MSSLLEIKSDLKDLISTCDEYLSKNEEIPKDLELRLSELLTKESEKIDGYCNILSWFQNEVDFAKEQIKKAQEFIDRKEKMIEKMKERALYVMKSFEVKKLEGSLGRKISMSSRDKVLVECEVDELPVEYVKATYSADKTAIKEALEAGKEIKGCKLIKNETVQWK